MEGFLRAIAIGESGAEVETQVLQCAYSQMSGMYDIQLNLEGAIEMAKKGLELSIKTGTVDPIYIMDVGTAAYHAGDTAEAMKYYKEAFEMIKRDGSGKKFPEVTAELLMRFSDLTLKENADYCLQCLNEMPEQKRPYNYLHGLGAYCARFVSTDSAAQVYKKMYDTTSSWGTKANSAWALMWYYRNRGDYKTSSDYAIIMKRARDSAIAERELEQTAIASGEQLYRRSRDAEQKAREKAANDRIIMYLTIIVALAVILSISLYFNARQRAANRLLRQKDAAIREAHETLESLNSQLTERQTRLDLVMVTQKERERELERLNDRVARTSEKMEKNGKALAEAKRELDKTGKQVRTLREELEQKQEELRRTQKKVRDLVGCTVAADADQTTSELVGRIQNSAARKEVASLSENDWNKLAAYIEALYPGFHLNARESIKDISPQKLRAACLWKIGLSQARIAQQMDFSPQTAMRWVKEFEEAFGDDT
jgi:tetratricopeptide (TPR) repeat protein